MYVRDAALRGKVKLVDAEWTRLGTPPLAPKGSRDQGRGAVEAIAWNAATRHSILSISAVRFPGRLWRARVCRVTELDDAMARLRAAERERRAAIDELIRLGAVCSHVLIGDLGELIAARYDGVPLLSPFTPGYDLVDRQGNRVQVKTLRATPTRPRTIIGEVRDPCDVVLAIRLDFDCAPTAALEIPRAVADQFVGKNDKVSWTHKLAAHPDVRHISA